VAAAEESKNESSINLRAGYHSYFLRIVFEGPGTIVSKGTVSRKDRDIIISFSDPAFKIEKNKLPLAYKRVKNEVILTPKERGRIKTFSLVNPSRLVIDVYKKTGDEKKQAASINKGIKESGKTKKVSSETKKQVQTAEINKDRIDAKDIKKKKTAKKIEKEKKTVTKEVSAKKDKKAVPPLKKEETKPEHKIEKAELASGRHRKYDFDDSFITAEYKEIWEVLKAGKSFGAIKMLSEHKPDNTESISIYHFLYGMAYSNLGKKLIAIDEFRLAYIYALDQNLKELSLYKRADLYRKAGLLYEARADYFVFIRDYEDSQYIRSAHLNLGKIFTELGNYDEAVDQYEKAGEMTEALFSRANALQRLGKVSEAREIYGKAMEADRKYIRNSPETYFLVGENMRMAGELEDAKDHLSEITDEPYKDRAVMSLGLIAMEESDAFNAIKRFKSLNDSKDRKIRVKALFNLHEAYIKAGRSGDAISALKKIRTGYPDSSLYKTTLMKLSGLYRKEGRLKDSVHLLKELVYGKEPPLEVFNELETLLLEASTKSRKSADEYELVELWKEVGQWMLDESREDFLLKITESLKHKGKPFLDLAIWLMENASGKARTRTAIYLADFFAGMGNPYVAAQYLGVSGSKRMI
jgi:tetratricopeptide (TPR) repeat protein